MCIEFENVKYLSSDWLWSHIILVMTDDTLIFKTTIVNYLWHKTTVVNNKLILNHRILLSYMHVIDVQSEMKGF